MMENSSFERFMPQHGLRPDRKEFYKGYTVLLAESGPHYDSEKDPGLEKGEFKNGYYAAVAIVREKIASWVGVCYFDRSHDLNMTEDGRKQARINAAFNLAKGHVDILDG